MDSPDGYRRREMTEPATTGCKPVLDGPVAAVR
jgi:hypothetical protein